MPDIEPATAVAGRESASSEGSSPMARTRSTFILSLVAGVASTMLYLFVVFSFAFLVPVQVAFTRAGRKAGLAAAGTAAILISGVLWTLLHGNGVSDFALSAIGIVPPLMFLLGQICMNAAFWDAKPALYRTLATTAVMTILAIPALVVLVQDASVVTYIAASLDAMFIAPMKAQAVQGYETSAIIATFDPKVLATAFIQTLASSYAALIFAMLGGSWWIGSRVPGFGSGARRAGSPIGEFRMPYFFIWPFLAFWALVLAAVFLKAPQIAKAAAMNCALVLSLAYAAQGLGIAVHFINRWNIPKSIRIAIAAIAIAALTTPTLNLVVAIALPVLGVTEVWIPYRTFKGVGA